MNSTPQNGAHARRHRPLRGELCPQRLSRPGLLVGLTALIWLLLRTGAKPSRLGYPCQQSALAIAAGAVGVPLTAALVAGRVGLLRFMRSTTGKLCGGFIAASLLIMFAAASYETAPAAVETLLAPSEYQPDIYFVRYSRGSDGPRFGGIDDLVTLMGASGLKLHRSQTTTPAAGPAGLIDADDVVLIKINAQWAERGGTNTDLLRGLIQRIVEHADGFVGEIVIADNGQGAGRLDRTDNNAEDRTQSPQRVAYEFAEGGFRVSAFLWDGIRHSSVGEYADGNYESGYVVNPVYDPETAVRVSYPKFRTAYGTYLSYKHGIWDQDRAIYEADRLVVINLPVLKTHSIYGVTAAVKNHMGVVSQALSTDSHNGVGRGGLGSVMADVRMPNLNILDCVWILAAPGSGPAASYAAADFRNQLAASVDPVALDAWSVRHILLPQLAQNGFQPVQYWAQDPDNPAGKFRQYLDRTLNELLIAGRPCTNDDSSARLHVWSGDLDRDGDLDLRDFAVVPGCFQDSDALPHVCGEFDYDLNGQLDLRDFAALQRQYTGAYQ